MISKTAAHLSVNTCSEPEARARAAVYAEYNLIRGTVFGVHLHVSYKDACEERALSQGPVQSALQPPKGSVLLQIRNQGLGKTGPLAP